MNRFHDFLFCNSVKIDYSSSLTQPTISIINEVVSLIYYIMQVNLMFSYPPYFLSKSNSTKETQKNEQAPKDSMASVNTETLTTSTEEQLNVNEFFHLDPDNQMINITSFLQACK